MWRHITSNFFSLLVVGLMLLGAFIALAQNKYQEAGPLEHPICLTVEEGSNMFRVSENLEAQGAISSSFVFRIGARYTDKARALKAGRFLVPAHASMEQITDLITRGGRSTCGPEIVYRVGVRKNQLQLREMDLATGKYNEIAAFDPVQEEPPATYETARQDGDVRLRVALAEGVTSWQVVEALKAADFLTGKIADIPPEGALAPDSYEVVEGSGRSALLARMQAAQSKILDEAWAARAPDLPLANKQEALILASIVEKETAIAAERQQVASVFINRLNKGIRLQTDPTVIYGITKGKGVLGRGLRQSELRRKTDYNTYQIDGLPKGPIANPGKASIEAALNNVAKWRKIEAER